MKRLWLAALLIICTATLQAQNASQRAASRTVEKGADSLNISSLKVDGLTYSRDISRIFWGDFDHVHIDRNGLQLSMMTDTYMRDFGVSCASALPKDKVEIMNGKCTEERYRIYSMTGFEVPGSRSCSETTLYGSGIYANPEVYRAYDEQTARAGWNIVGQIGSAMTKGGDSGFNAAVGMNMNNVDSLRQAKDLIVDMKRLIANNVCGGAPLTRFNRNLIAYLTNGVPVRMPGIPTSAGPFRDSDYQTLLDDLVAEQSTAWLMNRFEQDSIANVAVEKRDATGRPASISANYAYQSMDRKAEGKVELRFENGEPNCLVFADVPGSCRTLSPTIVAAYEDGKYVTAHPASARTYAAPDLRQVQVAVDNSQPVLVEIPAAAISTRQGMVVGTRGKLVRDLRGIGPGGTIVLERAGSPVILSMFASQRSTRITLGRVGETNDAVSFSGVSKELLAGVDTIPHDGSPLRVSFDVPSGMKRTMLLTEFDKQKVASNTSVPPPAVAVTPAPHATAGGTFGDSRPLSTTPDPRKVLLAGALLQLESASPITVGQLASGKLFPAIIVRTRSSAITERFRETLPEGTTVFLKITQGNGRQYRIEADHAVVQGVNVALTTNALTRVPIPNAPRSSPVRIGRLGPVGQPGELADADAVLVPAASLINLTTKSNASLDAAPR